MAFDPKDLLEGWFRQGNREAGFKNFLDTLLNQGTINQRTYDDALKHAEDVAKTNKDINIEPTQKYKDIANVTKEGADYSGFKGTASNVKPSNVGMLSKITNAFKAGQKVIAGAAGRFGGPVVSGVITGAEKHGHEQSPYVDDVVRAYDNANIIGSLGYLNPFTGLATFGKQSYNSAKAAEQMEMNKELMNTEYLDLLKAGVDPEVAFNNVYASKNAKVKPSDVGINIAKDREDQAKYLQQMNEIDTLEKQNADTAQNIQRIDMNNKLMQQALKEQPQRVSEVNPTATGGANKIAKASSEIPTSNGVNTPSGATTPSGANIPIGTTDNVLAQAIGYSNPQSVQNFDYTNFNGVGNYGLQVGTPQGMAQAAYDASPEGQLMNAITQPQEGQITPQDMMSILNDKYAKLEQTIKNDPRYSGDIVQPNTPYNIDPKQLARYQDYDQFAKVFGAQGGMADLYQNQARQMYDQQMANQLGVPYEDYIAATTERRKYDILAQSQQIQDALQVQANQAKDMQTKLGALQKMQEVREVTARELQKENLKGYYDTQQAYITGEYGNKNALINQAGETYRKQLDLNDPYNQYKKVGDATFNMSMALGGPRGIEQYALGLPNSARQPMVMSPDYEVTDETIKAIFGRGGNNNYVPFAQQPGQQGGGMGVLPTLSNWIRGNQ